MNQLFLIVGDAVSSGDMQEFCWPIAQANQLTKADMNEPEELAAAVSALAIVELATRATPKIRDNALRFMFHPHIGAAMPR